MTAPALLDSLAVRGFVVALEGDALTVAPFSQLTATECQAIKAAKPQLVALVRLREAAAARITESNHIRCDRELSRLWREAIEACPGDVVNIDGSSTPKPDVFAEVNASLMLDS